jgi:hypothetical protein
MRRAAVAILAGLAIAVAVRSSGAAAPPEPPRPEEVFQRSYFFDEQTRERLEAQVPAKQKALVEWGGAYIPTYTFFNNYSLRADGSLNQGGAHVTVQDLRLWAQFLLDDVNRIYARGLLRYTDWSAGDAGGFRQHDLQGMNLEVGYYELDIAGAARKYAHQDWPARALFRGGRQYIEVGRGIAMAKYLDAGWIQVETKDLRLELFGGRTIESEDNIDRSAPGFTHSRRNVYGMQAAYRGIPNHEPYVFLVYQRDRSEEKPIDPFQDYRYTSWYGGIGARGGLGPRTRYILEGIFEWGDSAANGQVGDSERIQAWAGDAQIDHFFNLPTNPLLSVEYAYASGDSDRTSATTAVGGNRIGTRDMEFQGFGYVNSGLALGARFSNIQFARIGGRFTPYEQKTGFGRLDLGYNFYWLWKAKAAGPISDTLAVNDSLDIGKEIDVFAEWRILSDLALSLHYGRLFPGDAYQDDEPRNFFFSALTFSF